MDQHKIKQLYKNLIHDASVYGISKFIVQFGSVLILPIYLGYLTPAENGILGYTAVVPGIFSYFMTFGLGSASERFYYEYAENVRKKKLGSLFLLSLILGALITLLLFFFSSPFFEYFFKDIPFYPYFSLTILNTFFISLSTHPFFIMRVSQQTKLFSTVTVLNFTTYILITLYLVIVLQMGLLGVILSQLINSILWGLYWIYWAIKNLEFNFNFKNLREEICYCLPGFPINFLSGVSGYLDRFLLSQSINLEQMGFYQIGSKFSNYYQNFNSVLKTAFMPMIFKNINSPEILREELSIISFFYFYLITIMALSSSLLLKEIIFIFGGDIYANSYVYIPFFIFGAMALNFGTAFSRGTDIVKKPKYDMYTAIMELLVRITLLLILTPVYQIWGAIFSQIISNIILSIVRTYIAHQLFPRKFAIKKILLILSLLFVCFFIGFYIPTQGIIIDLILKTILILCYSYLAFNIVRSMHTQKI